MDIKDLLFYLVFFSVVIVLAIKAIKDYKVLTTEKADNKIYINPKSFTWKGTVFIIMAICLVFCLHKNGTQNLLLTACLLAIGFWNFFFALKYRLYIKNRGK